MSEAESDTEKVETQPGSEAEQLNSATGSETEQLNSATEYKATSAQTATETVTKVKKSCHTETAGSTQTGPS